MKASPLRHTGWILFGQVLPALVGLWAVPTLLGRLGAERFGCFSLALMVLGYFSLFDLGLGRALTHQVARLDGEKDREELERVVATGLAALLLLGLMGGGLILALGPWISGSLLKLSVEVQTQALEALRIVACLVPLVTLMAGLRGLLEARLAFKELSLLRVPLGISVLLFPALAALAGADLPGTILALGVARLLNLVPLIWRTGRHFPSIYRFRPPEGRVLRQLGRFGGWMTLSNTLSPLLVQVDQFFLGSLLSVALVGLYATSFEVASKVLLLPAAFASVLFPTFSGRTDPGELRVLYERSFFHMVLGLLLPVLFGVALAHPFLAWWIGPAFAVEGTPILRVLLLAMFVNGLAHVPFAFIQGLGRPDLTARFHLVEFPLYVLLLWVMTLRFGPMGVACAWFLRALLDLGLVVMGADGLVPGATAGFRTFVVAMGGLALGMVGALALALPAWALVPGLGMLLVPLLFLRLLRRVPEPTI